MGEVHVAEQLALHREVALKLIRADRVADPASRARFLTEARACAKLKHPRIVTVYDAGEDTDGTLYIAMELVPGPTLRALIDAPMVWRRATEIARQIADGLAAAHEANILHRDLKPENVIVDGPLEAPRCTILDFGIAKLLGQPGGVTDTGVALGTPGFIAPEVAMHGQATAAADVYALGVVLFEMLTGTHPFTASTPVALVVRHATETAPALPAALAAPDALGEIVAACLAKDPLARPSARAAADALAAVVAGRAPDANVNANVSAPFATETSSMRTLAAPGPAQPTPAAAPIVTGPTASAVAVRPRARRNGAIVVTAAVAVVVVVALALGVLRTLSGPRVSGAPTVGDIAPPFALPLHRPYLGQATWSLDLSLIAGKRGARVAFVPLSCASCPSALARVRGFEASEQKLLVVAVVREDGELSPRARATLDAIADVVTNAPIAVDQHGAVAAQYAVTDDLVLLAIDERGTVAWRDEGVRALDRVPSGVSE
jgi:serine/threonine-protein kinase